MTSYRQVVTFIGAGGKTTCLQRLSREIALVGEQVIATTTTKVFPERHMPAWKDACVPPSPKGAVFWYAREETESGKWLGPSLNTVDRAIGEFPERCFWVVEGDGARGRRLKCWASHEPQIPRLTECAVLVLDRGLWGGILTADYVHRSEYCSDIIGHTWNAEHAWIYFQRSPVFKEEYRDMDWVILLNGSGETKENEFLAKNRIELGDQLEKLYGKWQEICGDEMAWEGIKPRHLRLAAGNAKEGDLRWFDLW